MNKLLITFTLFICSQSAYAGGASWLFSIKEYERISPVSAILKVELEPDEWSFLHNCNTSTFQLDFKPSLMESSTIDDFISVQNQKEALHLIEQAFTSNKPIKIGSMGAGLISIEKCVFKSKGLAILEEHNGSKEIYSFHNPI